MLELSSTPHAHLNYSTRVGPRDWEINVRREILESLLPSLVEQCGLYICTWLYTTISLNEKINSSGCRITTLRRSETLSVPL